MKIDLYKDNIDPELWNNLISLSIPDIHNIYQTLEWAYIMKTCYGLTPFFVIVRKGVDICGGQLYFKKPILKYFYAYESHGGPLCYNNDEILPVELATINHFRYRKDYPLYLLARPKICLGSENRYNQNGFTKSIFYTFILRLLQDENVIWKSFAKQIRNGVRKSEKFGIIVLQANSWDQWVSFYKIHIEHSRNRGIAPKDIKFFYILYKNFAPKGYAKLFVACQDSILVGGMLFLNYRGVMTYYIGASNDKFECTPNDLLMWNAITWGIKNSYNILDLGDTWPNPQSHLYGIHKFKEKWGGELVESSFFVRGNFYRFGRDLVLNNIYIQNIYERFHMCNLI